MKCEAKINSQYGGNYKCLCDATKSITIETFAPHLDRIVKKTRNLCNKHGKALIHRHRYQIKHMGKKTELTIQSLFPEGLALDKTKLP